MAALTGRLPPVCQMMATRSRSVRTSGLRRPESNIASQSARRRRCPPSVTVRSARAAIAPRSWRLQLREHQQARLRVIEEELELGPRASAGMRVTAAPIFQTAIAAIRFPGSSAREAPRDLQVDTAVERAGFDRWHSEFLERDRAVGLVVDDGQ